MTSFKFNRDPKRKQFMRLISNIHNLLDEAYWEEHTNRNLTKVEIAARLNVNKGLVSRWFGGTSNMTLETISNLAFVLGRDVVVSLPHKSNPSARMNYFVSEGEATSLKVTCTSTDAPPTLRASTSSSAGLIKTQQVYVQ